MLKGGGINWLGGSLCLFAVSTFSYNPQDPGWTYTGAVDGTSVE